MLKRLAEHYVALRLGDKEHKYAILREAKQRGYVVNIDVLRYATSYGKADIEEEIGETEGCFIRKYRPPLNKQIPREENWRQFDINPAASTVTLEEILS